MEGIMRKVMDLAVKAGGIIVRGRGFDVSSKGTKENYVTSTDVEVQEYLRKGLTEMLPGSYFMGEENDIPSEDERLRDSDRWVWIVDPIDGTANYARGMCNSVVSIALMRRGNVVVGVVHHPYLGMTFYACEGGGAFMNGEPLHVSDRKIENAMLATAWSTYNKKLAPACFRITERLYYVCEDIRRTGTAAFELCMLAKGAVDIYFEINLAPWDYAAASRIVKEAGGTVTSLDGDLNLYSPGPVIAGNTPANAEYVRRIAEEEIPADRPSA